MTQSTQSRIDAYTHVLPNKYREMLYRKARSHLSLDSLEDLKTHHDNIPSLFDIECRLRLMEGLDGLQQVLTMASPPLELVASPGDSLQHLELWHGAIRPAQPAKARTT